MTASPWEEANRGEEVGATAPWKDVLRVFPIQGGPHRIKTRGGRTGTKRHFGRARNREEGTGRGGGDHLGANTTGKESHIVTRPAP